MKSNIFKIGLLAAAAALVICLAGCNGSEGKSEDGAAATGTPEAAAPEAPAQTYLVGETVETDLARLTLDQSSLAIAITSSMRIGANAPSPIEQNYYLPVDYDASESGQKVAEKGHAFVCVEFTVENLDRADKIIGSSRYLSSARYDGNEYKAVHEGPTKSINTVYGQSFNKTSGHFYINTDKTRSNTVAPGETETVRAIIDIPVEVEDLSSPFEVTFALPTSSGETESFTYTVNQ